MKISHTHIFVMQKIVDPLLKLLNDLRDVFTLCARLWIGKIFFMAAIVKVTDWSSTLFLFQNVYHVPLLNTTIAAYSGTIAEFVLSISVILGLAGRPMMVIFFIYNIICVFSYHFLLTPAGMAGLNDHINWGFLLGFLMFYGSGSISLDHLLSKYFGHLVPKSHPASALRS